MGPEIYTHSYPINFNATLINKFPLRLIEMNMPSSFSGLKVKVATNVRDALDLPDERYYTLGNVLKKAAEYQNSPNFRHNFALSDKQLETRAVDTRFQLHIYGAVFLASASVAVLQMAGGGNSSWHWPNDFHIDHLALKTASIFLVLWYKKDKVDMRALRDFNHLRYLAGMDSIAV
jgi:hypothetical protein